MTRRERLVAAVAALLALSSCGTPDPVYFPASPGPSCSAVGR